MVYAAVTLDYYSADWLRLKKRKSRKMIGMVEVKKEDMDRKDRSKKEKFGQMHFCPFIPVQSSYLGGTRAHKVPASTAQKLPPNNSSACNLDPEQARLGQDCFIL